MKISNVVITDLYIKELILTIKKFEYSTGADFKLKFIYNRQIKLKKL
jgi:hypothetical protein